MDAILIITLMECSFFTGVFADDFELLDYMILDEDKYKYLFFNKNFII
jgi:hypothetical protein